MTQGFAREARIGVDLHVGETLYYTANDSFAKADYEGLYGVRVTCQGAGGGSSSSGQPGGGHGGGGGDCAISIILAADLSTSETITVGSGGSAGSDAAAYSAGGDGGESSFGSHVEGAGGQGGKGGRGGNGGEGSGTSSGDVIFGGSGGGGGLMGEVNSSNISGAGGASHLGGGGQGDSSTTSLGDTGKPYGGGGGAPSRTGSGGVVGGAGGADGIVIVEVLYERKIAVDEDIHTQYLNDTRHNNAHSTIRVTRDTSNQTLSNSALTDLVMNATDFEDDADGDYTFNSSTGEITVNNAGVYALAAGANFEADANGYRRIIIAVNGSGFVVQATWPTDANVPCGLTANSPKKLSAGDVVNVKGQQGAGHDLDVRTGDTTYLSIQKVSE